MDQGKKEQIDAGYLPKLQWHIQKALFFNRWQTVQEIAERLISAHKCNFNDYAKENFVRRVRRLVKTMHEAGFLERQELDNPGTNFKIYKYRKV
jgi:hypothetical protein